LNNQPILLYLLIFLALATALKLMGVIDVQTTELLGYAMIFYGINLVYTSFGKNVRGILFTGTSLFLIGLLIFLTDHFEFLNEREIIFPSILFIAGIGFLMLFFDDTSKKNFFIISATLIFTAIAVTAILGNITFPLFFNSIINITVKYWPVAVITIGIIIILHRENKKNP
jgi:hypothetical protein